MARLAVVTLRHNSGRIEDNVVNTFAFTGGAGMTTAETDALANGVINLYVSAMGTNTVPIGGRLSGVLSRSTDDSKVQIYDLDGHLDGSPHGSPIYEDLFTLPPASATTDLPEEVSIAVRLEAIGRADAPVEEQDGSDADLTPDRPKQRHTGRIYFGPLTTECLEARTTGFPTRVDNVIAGLFAEAVGALADITFQAALGTSARLGVWSRKDQRVTALERVYVDDAFDTQRRRGPSPSASYPRLVA